MGSFTFPLCAECAEIVGDAPGAWRPSSSDLGTRCHLCGGRCNQPPARSAAQQERTALENERFAAAYNRRHSAGVIRDDD